MSARRAEKETPAAVCPSRVLLIVLRVRRWRHHVLAAGAAVYVRAVWTVLLAFRGDFPYVHLFHEPQQKHRALPLRKRRRGPPNCHDLLARRRLGFRGTAPVGQPVARK